MSAEGGRCPASVPISPHQAPTDSNSNKIHTHLAAGTFACRLWSSFVVSRLLSSRGSHASEKTAVVTVSPPFSSTSHTKQPRYLPFGRDVQSPSWPMTTPPGSGRQCAFPFERGIPDGFPAVRGRLAFLHEARKSTIAFSWL